jgi:AraC-like DNA-binding protein
MIPINSGAPSGSGLGELIAFEGLIVQILTYNILAVRMLRKYRNIRWLEHFLVFLTGIYVLSFTISHLIMMGVEANKFYLLVQLTITLSIYLLSYKSILIPEIFSLKTSADPSRNGMKKYERSGLKPEEAVLYLEQLKLYMEERKAYLNPNMTIDQMAKDMGISRHHLTQVINEHFNKNFYGFVNHYRVEEVKRMITDKKYNHLSLSALGLEAGFKSKTTFNSNFKKETNLTPSEWKNRQKNRSRLSG